MKTVVRTVVFFHQYNYVIGHLRQLSVYLNARNIWRICLPSIIDEVLYTIHVALLPQVELAKYIIMIRWRLIIL